MTVPFRQPLPLLDNDLLRTFIAIAETGSFSAAAETVLRTPSAVSMQIKKLEEQLGAVLFLRDARSVRMTGEGAVLLTYARRMIALSNEAMARFKMPDLNGIVRLGAPDDIGGLMLPGILKLLSEAYPSLAIDVTIEGSAALRRSVEEGRLDLTLFNFLDGIAADSSQRVMTEKLVWVGKKCGTAHMKTPLPVSVWNDGCIWRKRALEALAVSEREFRIAYFCGHHMGQLAAIRADIAIAPLARFLVADDMVILGEREGLPDLGSYDIGLLVRDGADAPVAAVGNYLREALADMGAARFSVAA
ncbi:MAG: LysR family transcriptional regulator [Allorhizobium sp.]